MAERRSGITDWFPTAPLESWREMWRGQHRDLGIQTAADFFTDRNLEALAAIWRSASESPMAEALRFATTAIINRASRRYQWNPKRPTNVLSGTLYIASLTYEFNVFSLLRRKLRSVEQLARALADAPGSANVEVASATNLQTISGRSVDYVFTDPPFGANIYYSDASFLWEAWLDRFTETEDEAVVSTSLSADHGRKSLADYEDLMSESFSEITRVLKKNSWASVMFHNSDDAVWSGLERAIEAAGLSIESATAFDKSQPSFKGVKQITAQERVSSFDLVLQLRKASASKISSNGLDGPDMEKRVVEAVRELLGEAPPRRRSTPYVHSFVMRFLLERRMPLAGFSYRKVESLLRDNFECSGDKWGIPIMNENGNGDAQ